MIPKIIHLCWLSGEAFPESIQKCLVTWKEFLPDYEIWVWDTKRFDINSVLWTKQAYENHKYAFAADYIRLYVLYNYGGIYLDSDVIVYKSFNELLCLPYFIGQDYTRSFEVAVIGAEKRTTWIGEVLKRYQNRPFVKSDGTFDMLTLPEVFYQQLNLKYKFYKLHKFEKYESNATKIYVFDKDFFNSRNSVQVNRTPKSYCAHCYAGSWMTEKNDWKSKFKQILTLGLLNIYFIISHHTFNRDRIGRYEPKFENK